MKRDVASCCGMNCEWDSASGSPCRNRPMPQALRNLPLFITSIFLYFKVAHLFLNWRYFRTNKIKERKMTKLAEFFQDGKGTFSATRLGFLLWVISTLVVWIVGSINVINNPHPHPLTFPGIPDQVVYIIGALMTGKVWQSFSENAPPKDPSAPGA